MYNYVQIDEGGVVVSVSQLTGEVSAKNHYRVDEYNEGYVGQYYNAQTNEITPPTDETSA